MVAGKKIKKKKDEFVAQYGIDRKQLAGSGLLMGAEKEVGVSSLVRSQVVVLIWILGQNSLNTSNSEVSAGRKETEGEGNLEGRRQCAPSQCLMEKHVP